MFGKSGKFLGLRGQKLQVAVAAIAGMDFLLFGYDQGVTGGLLTLVSFRRQFPDIDQYDNTLTTAEIKQRSNYQGITVASYNLGCFFGRSCLLSAEVLSLRK